MSQVLSVVLNRQEDALLRFAGLCYRRGVFIERLAFSPDSKEENVFVEAVLACDPATAAQLKQHVAKLVDVVSTELKPKIERGIA